MYSRTHRRRRDLIWGERFGPAWTERYMACAMCTGDVNCRPCQLCMRHVFDACAREG